MKVIVKSLLFFESESTGVFSLLEYLKLISGMFVVRSETGILLEKNPKSGRCENRSGLRS
ncbi:hypothetical protein [Leptospira santarosai]|uniref:hypothetical protein n=1 Tax=Leptospira santarosai TaxID=28183 RepID=UPI0003075308|nr:hypothetical protein [Leptospira santarosai]MDI7189889.1 hypothetical protein [Leptospira santarosai]MDI7209240.1 hypothetical protein [Leptospira santarosai]MDI7215342.1 hypothetical protein [Leptospira santarosai]MDI7220777.1 hypothetical protein [Leptospira santarosai]